MAAQIVKKPVGRSYGGKRLNQNAVDGDVAPFSVLEMGLTGQCENVRNDQIDAPLVARFAVGASRKDEAVVSRIVERNLYARYPWVGVALMLMTDLVLFGAYGLTMWSVQMIWIPFWAAGVINGVGHYWGYRNFSCEDTSTNIVPWGILIGGEELHNNHHAFASSAKLSNKPFEFDIGWLYIRILESLGLAQVKRVAPTPRLQSAKVNVDAQTLQAVITHRYEVLASYAKSLKATYSEELEKLKRFAPGDAIALARVKRWLHLDEARLPEHAERDQIAPARMRALLRKGYTVQRNPDGSTTYWRALPAGAAPTDKARGDSAPEPDEHNTAAVDQPTLGDGAPEKEPA